MSVGPITPPVAPQIGALELGTISEQPKDGNSVAETFGKALQEATSAEKKANEAAEKFAKDDPSMGIHEVMIAAEKANIAVRYATTLKNKAVEAYRELMNTQV